MLNLSPDQQQLLQDIQAIASGFGYRLFAVGGMVRDFLLGEQSPPTDLDLVVEGGAMSAVIVARQLQAKYPVYYAEHPKFQTAELHWHNCTLDLATARQEYYPQAGANPIVSPANIEQDLWRRDFTINALAVEILSGLTISPVIDLFQGRSDLRAGVMRPIHPNSFWEDPRRIFRGARLAVRLGFRFLPAVIAEIREVCASGIHDQIGGSRLKAELAYLLQEPSLAKIQSMCQILSNLLAWRCLEVDFQPSANLTLQLRRLRRWQKWFAPRSHDDLQLETLLFGVSNEMLAKLTLASSQTQRIAQARQLLADLSQTGDHAPASYICDRLDQQHLHTLILAGAIAPHRWLWQYLTRWRYIPPLLSGKDLRALGYPVGKELGQLLQQIRHATLDGKISTKNEAISLADDYWRAKLGKIVPNQLG